MKKSKMKKMLKRYENLMWFCFIGMLVGGVFLGISLEGGHSLEEVFNAFACQGLPWIGVCAMILLLSEMLSVRAAAEWKFNRCYWCAFVGVLYAFVVIFTTKWNYGAAILPVIFGMRLIIPYSFVRRFNQVFSDEMY